MGEGESARDGIHIGGGEISGHPGEPFGRIGDQDRDRPFHVPVPRDEDLFDACDLPFCLHDVEEALRGKRIRIQDLPGDAFRDLPSLFWRFPLPRAFSPLEHRGISDSAHHDLIEAVVSFYKIELVIMQGFSIRKGSVKRGLNHRRLRFKGRNGLYNLLGSFLTAGDGSTSAGRH